MTFREFGIAVLLFTWVGYFLVSTLEYASHLAM